VKYLIIFCLLHCNALNYLFLGNKTKRKCCFGLWVPDEDDWSNAKLFWKDQWRKYQE